MKKIMKISGNEEDMKKEGVKMKKNEMVVMINNRKRKKERK